jgi:hypothetical protein
MRFLPHHSLTPLIVLCLALFGGAEVVGNTAGAEVEAPGDAPEFPLLTAPDTTRTNIWLVEALFGEVVQEIAAVLPPPPARIRFGADSEEVADDLFRSTAMRILGSRGYELFAAPLDSVLGEPVDYIFAHQVQGVELSYPEVGRTLGIWRRWVARDLTVTVWAEVIQADSGRLLFSNRVVRRFSDRIDKDDFATVDSPLYPFTTAETGESGWHRRFEEIVVLGALTGLVVIYFANTGN